MSGDTRRGFLKKATVAGSLLFGPAACTPREEAAAPAAKAAKSTAAEEPQYTKPAPPKPDPEGRVQMTIAQFKKPDEAAAPDMAQLAARLTEKAIGELGGMGRFVKAGDVVWIKPNIGFQSAPEYAANTNPDVVATLVRLCLEAGAGKVRVGDNSCYGALEAYPLSGIEAAAAAAGAEVVYFKAENFKEMQIDGERLVVWPLYTEVVEANLVINVPVLKHHSLTKVSSCFKNYMGIAGGSRFLWHSDLPTCLTDVAAFMKPRLTVVDAVRTITKLGPTCGNLDHVKFVGKVAAGTDIVALEAFGAELLGNDPAESRTMRRAQERDLGTIDYRALKLKEIDVTL